MATPIIAGIAALVLGFASQEPCTIQHKEALWHYDGMRVILAKMAKDLPNGGFFWIRPWELLSNEDSHEDVSRKITSNITS